MIVSVVTRGVSDDANSWVVDGRTVWLRVSRIDHAFAYHASLDGKTWRMIRFFTIDGTPTSGAIGFEAQSPTGDGCVVTSTTSASRASAWAICATAREPSPGVVTGSCAQQLRT